MHMAGAGEARSAKYYTDHTHHTSSSSPNDMHMAGAGEVAQARSADRRELACAEGHVRAVAVASRKRRQAGAPPAG